MTETFEDRVAWHMKRLRGERVPARRTPDLDALEAARIRAYANAKAVQHRSLQIIQERRGADQEFIRDPGAPSREQWLRTVGPTDTRDAGDVETKDCVNE